MNTMLTLIRLAERAVAALERIAEGGAPPRPACDHCGQDPWLAHKPWCRHAEKSA